jgi:hypothetical protein
MPSPIGHALAGAAVVWAADLIDRRPSPTRLVVTGAVVATLPDLDLIVTRYHRSATHSLVAVLIVLIIAAAVTGRVNRWRVALVCAAAYASHLLLDWMAADSLAPFGVQLFWPFSPTFYISGWDVFEQTERRRLFSRATMNQNVPAVIQEVAILAPIALALWLVSIKTLARFPTKLAARDHAAQ